MLLLGVLVVVMVGLFLTEKLPLDLTASLGLVVLVLGGFVTAEEAFAGFGSPTVISIVAVFVLGAALNETGAADLVGRRLHALAGDDEVRLLVALVLVEAALSAFMNNIAATAVLMPAVAVIARRSGIAPSRLFMPLAFGAILGGTLTQVGTPPNLLASQLLAEHGEEPFGLFDFTPVGLAILVAGLGFLVTAGRRLLPTHESHEAPPEGARDLAGVYQLEGRLFSLRLPADSPLAGRSLAEVRFANIYGVKVISILHEGGRELAPSGASRLAGGDVLLVEGEAARVQRLIQGADEDRTPGEAVAPLAGAEPALESEEVGVVEAALAPRSALGGRSLADLEFAERYGLIALALWRDGRPHYAELATIPLRAGDALLLQGPRPRIRLLAKDADWVVLSETERSPHRTRRAPFAFAALALMIALVITGWQPIHVAAFTAATLVVLSGALTMREAYRAIEWRTTLLIAAILPLGTAVERSGAALAMAEGLTNLVGPLGPYALLAGLAVFSSLASQVLDGASAVVLLSPMVFATAVTMQVDPRPLMMGVALGASAAFMTPFSQKSNLLVMGAGGYRSGDFLRVGTPLTALVLLLIVLLVPVFFPF